jgi:N-acetylmuramoyl-L-alanine amidase
MNKLGTEALDKPLQLEGRTVLPMPSPNFSPQEIPVEYLLLHYTGVSLAKTQEIFSTPERASAHLVIDRDGQIYECIACLGDHVYKAWHAGVSQLQLPDGSILNSFNSCAIGIELVNFNGNIFPFSEQQYASLAAALRHFKTRHPALENPARILGHEDVAGFRGKADPGLLFDWPRLEREVYGTESGRVSTQALPANIAAIFTQIYAEFSLQQLAQGELAAALSLLCESAATLAQGQQNNTDLESTRQDLQQRTTALAPQLSTKALEATQRLLRVVLGR